MSKIIELLKMGGRKVSNSKIKNYDSELTLEDI